MQRRGARTGWTLDTPEIGGAQTVVGIGISLDPSWTNPKGFRLGAANGMNGPSLAAVGIGFSGLIPAPGAAVLVGAGAAPSLKRHRR